ncbi:MAG TPA: PepSY domain-containing protein, partial [Terriglobales bacterium]
KTGEVIRAEPFSSYNLGRRLRTWGRFLHTGEAGGIAGQTIAAIASAGAALLVWTGISLALRRLWAWRNDRRKSVRSKQEIAA